MGLVCCCVGDVLIVSYCGGVAVVHGCCVVMVL